MTVSVYSVYQVSLPNSQATHRLILDLFVEIRRLTSLYSSRPAHGMRRSQPLPDTHPELTILEHPSSREFRVENWRLARDGSKKVLKFYGWSWFDAAVPVLLAVLWPVVRLVSLPDKLCQLKWTNTRLLSASSERWLRLWQSSPTRISSAHKSCGVRPLWLLREHCWDWH